MILADSSDAGLIASIVVAYALTSLAMATMFHKAGIPWILGIIPIVSTVFMFKLAGYSMWLALLLLVPIVNIVMYIIVLHGVSRHFGHGVGFTIGLIFLFVIFGLILGLGSSQYRETV